MSQKQNALFFCLKYQKVHRGDTMLTSFLSLGLKLKFQELCLQMEVEMKVPTLLIEQVESTYGVCGRAI